MLLAYERKGERKVKIGERKGGGREGGREGEKAEGGREGGREEGSTGILVGLGA